MKKNKKIVVTITIIILLIATGAVIYLTSFKNSNQLSIKDVMIGFHAEEKIN